MLLKTTTIKEANKNQEIKIKTVIPSEEIFVNGGKKNFHLRDIFGNYHRFFRPYTHKTQDYNIYTLPYGYCFCNQEIVFTKNKKILLEQTSYKIHPLLPQKLYFSLGGGE